MNAIIVIVALLVGTFGHVSVARAQQAGVSPAAPAVQPPQDDYIIGVQDSVNVTVWENADLTGKFTVQPDGAITCRSSAGSRRPDCRCAGSKRS